MNTPSIDIPVARAVGHLRRRHRPAVRGRALDVRGRVVRLGPALDDILDRHDYPAPVAKLLGEAVVLTVLLGSALKFEGRFILQTQTDGPVACWSSISPRPARCAPARASTRRGSPSAIAAGKADAGELLGNGHLAMTIDQGADTSRYQGIVALDGGASRRPRTNISAGPSRSRRGCGSRSPRNCRAGDGGATAGAPAASCCSSCRKSPERARVADLDPGDAPEGTAAACGRRRTMPGSKAARLIATVEDHELIDPALSSERLLYRLFHERGVRVFNEHRDARAVLVLARQRRGHAARASRRTTATTWSRTARSR